MALLPSANALPFLFFTTETFMISPLRTRVKMTSGVFETFPRMPDKGIGRDVPSSSPLM